MTGDSGIGEIKTGAFRKESARSVIVAIYNSGSPSARPIRSFEHDKMFLRIGSRIFPQYADCVYRLSYRDTKALQ